jgi:PAS domain S-box-containing protein
MLRTRSIRGLGFCVVLALLISATIAIERDTARRRGAEAARDSEEQFRQVFEESPGGILLINDDLRIRRGNPAVCRLLGYEESEIERLTLPAITAWDGLANETQCHIDQQCVTKSGGTVWVNVNAAEIRNSQGRVLFNLALIEDITLRKRADETIRAMTDSLELRVERRTQELADANRRLAAANTELEAFAYSVSHDLRAPLRSVDCFSQIIIEEYADKLDEDGTRYLQRIRAGAKTMSQLIDDLLNLARLSRAHLKREPVHLSSMALSIVNEWRDREPDRVIQAEIAPDVQAPGDARLLRVVLDNLLGNAWKFTKQTRKCISRIRRPELAGRDRLLYPG